MVNTQYSMLALQRPMKVCSRVLQAGMLGIGYCGFCVCVLDVHAQAPVQFNPALAAQLQVQQMPVEVAPPETITAKSEFDPPVARPGETVFYRVALNATRNSIQWPEALPATPNLALGPMEGGQIPLIEGNRYRPLTMFICEAMATETGRFTISNFVVTCNGRSLEIPAASFEVLTDAPISDRQRPRMQLQASSTNLYAGQPFRLRVMMASGPDNRIETLREVQFNGGGFMVDKTQMRQAIENIAVNGQPRPAFIYETVATPIASGRLKVSAQAFTAGQNFSGPITITGQVTLPGGPPSYVLQLTETLTLNVRPLPVEAELPGFTGAIGHFQPEPLQFSTNRIRVGEPLHLKYGFTGENNLDRYVPPLMPRSREWQIILDRPPGSGITFIPRTDEVTHTPAIPFSAFDPATEKFYDLTIPAQPVTVIGEGLPLELTPYGEAENTPAPLKMSGLALTAGKTMKSLVPLQLQGWFVALQILPLAGFIALWRWDCRRRFLEAHPEIVRRRQAKRALRQERKQLRQALIAGQAEQFVQHAASAMRIAAAPHFPANARALVGGDVLSQLGDAADKAMAETVRTVFAATDAQFSIKPDTAVSLSTLASGVDNVLRILEDRL